MISFELFSEMITRWKNGHKEIERFDEALKPFFDSYPIVNIASDALSALEELINISCGMDKNSDLLSWWAFEDVEKIIYIPDEDKKYRVENVEELYRYILDMNKNHNFKDTKGETT